MARTTIGMTRCGKHRWTWRNLPDLDRMIGVGHRATGVTRESVPATGFKRVYARTS